ncbi:MGDG synthase family glycosyltransferase [Paenibacillus popilliae]|nr:UDP-glucuronosyltransferase [Paenibacillus popilliae]
MAKKVLLLPFLQIKMGHHQAADALVAHLMLIDQSIECDIVDLLDYSYGSRVGGLVSSTYLKWIHFLPLTYSWMYRKSCGGQLPQKRRYRLYEMIFMRAMQRLIQEKQPDCILCTHALPSYLLDRLKCKGLLSIPVVNVYTDFFINDVWGRDGIDFHFVPDTHIKEWLTSRSVQNEHIFVTGIPVHPQFTATRPERKQSKSEYTVLITGGNLGAGVMKSMCRTIGKVKGVRYIVLCGKNRALFRHLKKKNCPRIVPMPYIESRDEMNDLYNQADAVLAKPGGVTVSECLYKKVPILVYHALPGQEEINLLHLLHQQLIVYVKDWAKETMDKQIMLLWNDTVMDRMTVQMNEYGRKISDLRSTLCHILKLQQ